MHRSIPIFTNEGLYGKYNAYKDNIKDKLTEQSTKTFGGTLSGPIIKDKLFFFANAETVRNLIPPVSMPDMTRKDFPPIWHRK